MTRETISRRRFVGTTGALFAALSMGLLPRRLGGQPMDIPDTGTGPYSLPPLPYDYDALMPHIDEQTMRVHYGKHHAGYVTKLNAAVTGVNYEAPANPATLIRSISKLPKEIQTAVRHNGGGHANHTFFWSILSPQGGGTPDGVLLDAIQRDFGSFEDFKKRFKDEATSVFGSGWAWLVVGADGKLALVHTANQDNPLMDVVDVKGQPILGLDVWEHAYYLKYQNRRADYIDAFWNIVKWPTVAAYASSAGLKA